MLPNFSSIGDWVISDCFLDWKEKMGKLVIEQFWEMADFSKLLFEKTGRKKNKLAKEQKKKSLG
jgi:hypothetical protein